MEVTRWNPKKHTKQTTMDYTVREYSQTLLKLYNAWQTEYILLVSGIVNIIIFLSIKAVETMLNQSWRI